MLLRVERLIDVDGDTGHTEIYMDTEYCVFQSLVIGEVIGHSDAHLR